MKKIVALILTLAFAVSLFSFPGHAEEMNIQHHLEIKSAMYDYEVVFTVSLKENSGFCDMSVMLYTPGFLSFKSAITPVAGLTCTAVSWNKFTLSGDSDYTGTGDLLLVTYTVTPEYAGAWFEPVAEIVSVQNKAGEKLENLYTDNQAWLKAPQPKLAGDINASGSVDVMDLIRLQKYISGQPVIISTVCADVNDDGKVDLFDIIRLKKVLSGLT